jgi:hypothetical protein
MKNVKGMAPVNKVARVRVFMAACVTRNAVVRSKIVNSVKLKIDL